MIGISKPMDSTSYIKMIYENTKERENMIYRYLVQ